MSFAPSVCMSKKAVLPHASPGGTFASVQELKAS